MKAIQKLLLLLLLVVLPACSASYRPYSQRSATGTTQIFYDELSPYGDWVHNREYGYVWIPNVGGNFYPYATNGRWVLTDYGWTWFSGYPWGWAPFHYGRWDFDPQYGWFWFPGDQWAPAWVIWRQADGYFGWAPMGPEPSVGFDYRNRDDVYRYIFVRDRDFGKSNINRYYINRRRNDEIIRNSRVISEYRTDNSGRRVYVSGPDPALIENSTGRRIRRITVTDSNIPGRRLSKNQLEIYRPGVVTVREGQRPAPSRITDVKDIRPMRERNRDYQPETPETNEAVRDYGGQGEREVNREQVQNQRERDTRREYQQKQDEMQRRQLERELQQQQRNADEERRRQAVENEYQKNRSERIQRSEQQKKTMQKDRERSSREVNDTSITRKSQQTRSIKQNRR